MNGIIRGVLRCQRFIHSLATSAFIRQYTKWYRLLHLKTITVSSYLYNNRMDAKLANALSHEIQLIVTPDIGGFIQPERLLLMILITTIGRWIE